MSRDLVIADEEEIILNSDAVDGSSQHSTSPVAFAAARCVELSIRDLIRVLNG